jgi:hypothetical protein
MSDIIAKQKEERVINKLRNSPSTMIGLLGLSSIVGFSVYHYRKKPADMKTSLYM